MLTERVISLHENASGHFRATSELWPQTPCGMGFKQEPVPNSWERLLSGHLLSLWSATKRCCNSRNSGSLTALSYLLTLFKRVERNQLSTTLYRRSSISCSNAARSKGDGNRFTTSPSRLMTNFTKFHSMSAANSIPSPWFCCGKCVTVPQLYV